QDPEIAAEVMLPLKLQGIAEIRKCGRRPLQVYGPPGKAELGAARIPETDVSGVRRERHQLCLRRADLTDGTAPAGCRITRRNSGGRAAARGSLAKTGAARSSGPGSVGGARCRLSCPAPSCRATIVASVDRARSQCAFGKSFPTRGALAASVPPHR